MIGFKKDISIVLASASPRRRALLENICGGSFFEVIVPDIEELPRKGESAKDYVQRNSASKAVAVLSRLEAGKKYLILAADTVVCFKDKILEKPLDENHAREMLSSLSGQTHEVWTGVHCIYVAKDQESRKIFFEEKTKVLFRELSDLEIDNYIRSGEPLDKAGSYGAQGLASSFVKSIQGSYTNVVGLPLSQWIEYLREKTPEVFERI